MDNFTILPTNIPAVDYNKTNLFHSLHGHNVNILQEIYFAKTVLECIQYSMSGSYSNARPTNVQRVNARFV